MSFSGLEEPDPYMVRLHSVLHSDVQVALDVCLRHVVEIQKGDFGVVRICAGSGAGPAMLLRQIVEFSPAGDDILTGAFADDDTACRRAATSRDIVFAPFGDGGTAASFPLLAADGSALGVLSTFFIASTELSPEVIKATEVFAAWMAMELERDNLRAEREGQRRLIFDLEAAERSFMADVQRRVRSIFATLRAISRRTASSSRAVDDYVMHFEGRLAALGRVQALTLRHFESRASLVAVLSSELDAFGLDERRGVTMSGPDVQLRSRSAEVMGLAFHELATNAIKFGGLGSGGTIDIGWGTDDGLGLVIEWRESGTARGPATGQEPRGFGTEVLEQMIAFELKGSGSRLALPDGFGWRIELPHDCFSLLEGSGAPHDAPLRHA